MMDTEQQNALLAGVVNQFGFLVLASRLRVPPGTVVPAGTWAGGQGWPRVQQSGVVMREATAEEWNAQFTWITAQLTERKCLSLEPENLFYYAVTFD